MDNSSKKNKTKYFNNAIGLPIKKPSHFKSIVSRIALPLLALISREQSVRIGLVPLDDERVIKTLEYTTGRALDIGCGSNNYIRSYGNGIGVDVYPWDGVDVVVKDTSKLPFKKSEFRTVTLIACLNHIPNRADVLDEAHRVMKKNGTILITMISPRWGQFIHWIRFRNDPDHQDRDIDHDHELLGMHSSHVKSLMKDAGFEIVKTKRFVFGINTIYIGSKR